MINLTSINYRYPKSVLVYQDFSLNLQAGTICGLFGKNGEGKSTLLKLASGLLFPQAGTIMVDEFTPQQRQAAFLANVFFVAEDFKLPKLTQQQYVKLYSAFYPGFSHEQFNSYLAEFEVNNRLPLAKLSFGNKKKFFIAFALATNCKYLLLDEPTNGLDIPSKVILRKLLLQRRNEANLVTLISTHQAHDIEGAINSIIILNGNKVLNQNDLALFYDSLHIEEHEQPTAEALYSEQTATSYSCLMQGPPSNKGERVTVEFIFNALLTNSAAIEEALKGNFNITSRKGV
ncbi:MAG: ABC transporter ATP-binding protein [Spirochaetaceae bacterium]|nr:ABC transporter ATP-binding protein [Spirochaetaceae bacterium]